MKTPDELQGSKKSHAGLQSGAYLSEYRSIKGNLRDSIEKNG